MDAMSRFVEITIISAEGLMINRNKPVKKNAFVTIQTDTQAASMRTKVDVDGGSYPSWNEKLIVQIPMHARFLTVGVQCKVYNGCKVIGTVNIPISDFTGGYLPYNYLHFLSYRLRDRNGERNGIINISVKSKDNVNVNVNVNGGGCDSGSSVTECGRYYLKPNSISHPVGQMISSGVVTGVPVWHR